MSATTTTTTTTPPPAARGRPLKRQASSRFSQWFKKKNAASDKKPAVEEKAAPARTRFQQWWKKKKNAAKQTERPRSNESIEARAVQKKRRSVDEGMKRPALSKQEGARSPSQGKVTESMTIVPKLPRPFAKKRPRSEEGISKPGPTKKPRSLEATTQEGIMTTTSQVTTPGPERSLKVTEGIMTVTMPPKTSPLKRPDSKTEPWSLQVAVTPCKEKPETTPTNSFQVSVPLAMPKPFQTTTLPTAATTVITPTIEKQTEPKPLEAKLSQTKTVPPATTENTQLTEPLKTTTSTKGVKKATSSTVTLLINEQMSPKEKKKRSKKVSAQANERKHPQRPWHHDTLEEPSAPTSAVHRFYEKHTASNPLANTFEEPLVKERPSGTSLGRAETPKNLTPENSTGTPCQARKTNNCHPFMPRPGEAAEQPATTENKMYAPMFVPTMLVPKMTGPTMVDPVVGPLFVPTMMVPTMDPTMVAPTSFETDSMVDPTPRFETADFDSLYQQHH